MGNLLGIPHKYLGAQYTGIWGTKRIIRWLYPRAVKAFDDCSRRHDQAYDQENPAAWDFIDWRKGAAATLQADRFWRECALIAAGQDIELRCNAEFFFRVMRRWGRFRAALWRAFYGDEGGPDGRRPF